MRVHIECEIGAVWGIEELDDPLDDNAVIELLHEDIPALLDGSVWTIIREPVEGEGK